MKPDPMKFVIPTPDRIPPVPSTHASRLRTIVEGLPLGGFVFVKGDTVPPKRVSDLCHSLRTRKGYGVINRRMTYEGEEGFGIWITSKPARQARPVQVDVAVPHPTLDALMGRR